MGINKIKAIDQLSTLTAQILQQIESAITIERKIGKLPFNWEVSFINSNYWHGLLFYRHTEKDKDGNWELGVDPKEFKLVCSLIENKLNIKLDKSPWISEDKLYALEASHDYSLNCKNKLHIEVRCTDVSKSCELKIIEKIIKVAEMSEECKKEFGMN